MSTLTRRDYFINLRKSFHINFRPSCSSETLILINTLVDEFPTLIVKKALIEADLDRIDQLLVKLEDKLEQYKFGLPTLLITTEQGIYSATKSEIDRLCLKVKNDLGSSFTSITNDALNSNIGAHLANRLTEQYEKFQVFQKMFASILYDRFVTKVMAEKVELVEDLCTSGHGASETCVSQSVSEYHVQQQSPMQQQSTLCTVVLNEAQESMLEERTHEITTILADTLHLNDLLHQIQLMTVQQGSLLDRIDVNLDKTRGNLKLTIGGLEKTAESITARQKRFILFFIALAIFVVSLLIFSK